jgi:hypothetical protein
MQNAVLGKEIPWLDGMNTTSILVSDNDPGAGSVVGALPGETVLTALIVE